MTLSEPCPCCGHRTLPERGGYDVCPVCEWEDDPEQAERPWAWGGANGVSLVEAQQAYLRLEALNTGDDSKGRPPKADEARAQDWRPHDPEEGEPHPLYSEAEQLQAEVQGQAHWTAFQGGLKTIRTDGVGLSDEEIQRRVRELSETLDLHYGDAEVELLAQLMRNEHWPRRHPVQALAWAWRHRLSTSLCARLSQLRFAPFSE